MKPKKLLEIINSLSADDTAKLIALLVPKCLPSKKNWKDYYYRYFHFWEQKGFHITPNHYYSPLPDLYKLRRDLWEKIAPPVGIDLRGKEQIKLLKTFKHKYMDEYKDLPIEKTSNPFQYSLIGGRYEGIDGLVLYCMIRHFKPKRIIEIGSGSSTLLAGQACLKNKDDGIATELIAIEPYPDKILKKGFPGLTKLITKKVQEVDLKLFDQLGPRDFLFIDSSHVLKIDGDVKLEYTAILPRLKKGVLIHIHDIFLPADYPKEFIYGLLFFFNEQYLVQAILANSNNFEILWAGQYMFMEHFKELLQTFPAYKQIKKSPKHSSSFWIKKTG